MSIVNQKNLILCLLFGLICRQITPATDCQPFPAQASLLYANGFQVEYRLGHKIVKTQTAGKNQGYLLKAKNCPLPDNPLHYPVIEIPVRSFMTMSTTHLHNIEKLDLFSYLKGVANATESVNITLQKLIKEHKIENLGPEPQPDLEKIVSLRPELIFACGIDKVEAHYEKLANLDIPVVLNAEFTENHPLAYAEWIKFMALFFNLEEKAEQYFQQIVLAYQEIQQLTHGLKKKPTVFLNTVYSDAWFMPGGKSFMARLIADAGGEYILAQNNSNYSLPLSLEYVLQKAWSADIWLNPGGCKTLAELSGQNSHYRIFQAFKKQRVYNCNRKSLKSEKNDFWENGLANPHKLLAELIAIFHPQLIPEQQFEWYHRLK